MKLMYILTKSYTVQNFFLRECCITPLFQHATSPVGGALKRELFVCAVKAFFVYIFEKYGLFLKNCYYKKYSA